MLPSQYQWLSKETGPKSLVEMLRIYGTIETPGSKNNPVIMGWAAEIGVQAVYTADSVPWCGLGMGVVMKRAGKAIPSTPLWALSWADFGVDAKPLGGPGLGDVLVFKRKTPDGKTAGHVTLYVGEDETAYHCIGANQSDQVNVTRIAKNRLYAARRPIYNVQPANVRRVMLSSAGGLSDNEA